MRGLKQKKLNLKSLKRRVAPLAGAGIETKICLDFAVCGLVAPLAGAWIETLRSQTAQDVPQVAPLAGAWIETLIKSKPRCTLISRTPRGCVD